ncbi:hypothetical protein EUGRSUZ_L00779 [Eucalyptus grandis]|uniref:Uncharacterized protein n=1 Tax=Eucalyptus grandis TaxID=71139 RepID=A0A058ZUR0_EUCGR|nr:hypothetical protein EUGRSUZ_L00779 [Eucalyptus grandis]
MHQLRILKDSKKEYLLANRTPAKTLQPRGSHYVTKSLFSSHVNIIDLEKEYHGTRVLSNSNKLSHQVYFAFPPQYHKSFQQVFDKSYL